MINDVAVRHSSSSRLADGPSSRGLLNALPAAVYTCDAEGRVQLFNQAAVALWGRTPVAGEDLWCGSWRIYRPDGSPLPLDECPMAVTIREGRAVRGEHIIIERPDGTRCHVLPHPEPLFDSEGTLIGAMNMLVDITEYERTKVALSEGEARLAAIVDSSDDAIVSKTLDGVITSWNRGAERLFGFSSDEAIGKHISLIIPTERWQEEQMVLARLRRGERIDHFETERRAKDGHLLNISLTVSPIKDATGRIIGASKVARDITERKRAEAILRDADRHKDEFIAMLSHELRNPLNAMLGWMRMLRSGLLDRATAERACEVIERNIDHQNRLISDLLDVSRIAAGKLVLEVGPVNLADVVRTVADTLAPSARSEGLTLTTSLTTENLPLLGDAERLRQMLGNLVSNAIKFTPRGGQVRVECERSNDAIRVRVSDTGMGIDRAFLPHVFERFKQAGGDSSRAKGGLGLGLAIVRHIVELHGGRVWVESEGRGAGAMFTIDLPVAAVVHIGKNEGQVQLTQPALVLNGLRILVVEDHADSRDLIVEILRQAGAQVDATDNAREAAQIVRSIRPDAMICDIGMPEDDGISLIREIRSWQADEGGNTAAVALTGYARTEDRDHALASGFHLHVSKPAEPRVLVESVSRLCRRAR